MNGTNTGIRLGITIDSSTNIYLTGTYAGTLVIRNADNSVFLSTAGPGNQWDIGVIKYNSSGTPQWFRRMGSSGDDRGLGISSDQLGNTYVTGYYSSALTIFNGNGIQPAATSFTILENSGAEDAFLVKYSTTGVPLWATRISGTGSDIGRAITVDSTGAGIYLMGYSASNPLTLRTTGF